VIGVREMKTEVRAENVPKKCGFAPRDPIVTTGEAATQIAHQLLERLHQLSTIVSKESIREELLHQFESSVDNSMSLLGLIVTLGIWDDEELLEVLNRYFFCSADESSRLEQSDLETLLQASKSVPQVFSVFGKVPVCVVGGRNLLHLLAEFSYSNTVKYLLSIGAVENVDDAGILPRDIANPISKSVFEASVIRAALSPLQVQTREREYIKHLQTARKEERIRSTNYSSVSEVDKSAKREMNQFKEQLLTIENSEGIIRISDSIVLLRDLLPLGATSQLMAIVNQVYKSGEYQAPNSLNRIGFTCQDTAMDAFVRDFAQYIQPLRSCISLPESTHQNIPHIHSFVISYVYHPQDASLSTLCKHVDNSMWTVNVCLYAQHAENAVQFYPRPRAAVEVSSLQEEKADFDSQSIEAAKHSVEEEPEFSVQLHTGDVLIHRGDIFHATSGRMTDSDGERTNLVIWFKD
jgi:hypothetical protein